MPLLQSCAGFRDWLHANEPTPFRGLTRVDCSPSLPLPLAVSLLRWSSSSSSPVSLLCSLIYCPLSSSCAAPRALLHCASLACTHQLLREPVPPLTLRTSSSPLRHSWDCRRHSCARIAYTTPPGSTSRRCPSALAARGSALLTACLPEFQPNPLPVTVDDCRHHVCQPTCC